MIGSIHTHGVVLNITALPTDLVLDGVGASSKGGEMDIAESDLV
jgi:hypothetical protein